MSVRVTIGILCFNAEDTISKAIESAINQTWDNKEIIIVDDNSTDKSLQIIDKYLLHKNILLFKNDLNMGPAFSRNIVIDNATGDLIGFMDDDDISEKNRISYQVKSIYEKGYPERKHIISTCGIIRTYQTGYKLYLKPMGVKGKLPIGKELADFLLYNKKNQNTDYGFGIPTCSMLATKECFNDSGNFDINLKRVEDMEICIRFSLANYIFTSTEKFLVFQKSSSGSDKSPEKNYESEIKLVKKYKKYLVSKKMFRYSLFWPRLRFYHFKKNYLNMLGILIILLFINPIRTIPHFLNSSIKRFSHERKISQG